MTFLQELGNLKKVHRQFLTYCHTQIKNIESPLVNRHEYDNVLTELRVSKSHSGL